MISIKSKGDFSKTLRYFKKMQEVLNSGVLERYGQMGIDALRTATPVESGKTASSWGFTTETRGTSIKLIWTNSNVNDGCNIAILIQYGHGTGWGTYVEGTDYINPAMRPIFEEISQLVWKEVTKA
ncbi:MAG: HK97 gp10 family phage protein [Pseudobutyrivibrio sp.]|nr:HK97 gp10 family phage protein [Pseudobutyrivibrio sp.]